jgi:hypothetical protein
MTISKSSFGIESANAGAVDCIVQTSEFLDGLLYAVDNGLFVSDVDTTLMTDVSADIFFSSFTMALMGLQSKRANERMP